MVSYTVTALGRPVVYESSPLFVLSTPAVGDGHATLRTLLPAEVLELVEADLDACIRSADALVIEWSAANAGVMLAVRDTAHRHGIPILALSAPNTVDQIAALYLGADDVIVKPLNLNLVAAKVDAYQRRAWARHGDGATPPARLTVPAGAADAPPDDGLSVAGPLLLDRKARRFYVQGRPVQLTPREFDLMGLLIDEPGTCQRRDRILNAVWGIDFDTETNVLDVHIYTLRRKLSAAGVKGLIQTVRGVGYRLVEAPDEPARP